MELSRNQVQGEINMLYSYMLFVNKKTDGLNTKF